MPNYSLLRVLSYMIFSKNLDIKAIENHFVVAKE